MIPTAKMSKYMLATAIREFRHLTSSIYRHKIYNLTLYTTNRCNSRCITCNIWKKVPKQDLDVDIIREVLNDEAVDKDITLFGLGGGEPLLHPKFEEILSLLCNYNYILLSNGVLADRLIQAVRDFKVKSLLLSLDGTPDTHKRIRGVDNYSAIEKIVSELKEDDVSISISYTASPWNTPDDLFHVMEFCRRNELCFGVGYYNNLEYFETTKEAGHLYSVSDLFPNLYTSFYDLWISGNLKLPCYSIRLKRTVMPNGDVNLCEQKEIKLGNLHEQRLGDICKSKETVELQNKYVACNDCWLDCHRPIDIYIAILLRSLIPYPLIRKFVGPYDWRKVPSIWNLLRTPLRYPVKR